MVEILSRLNLDSEKIIAFLKNKESFCLDENLYPLLLEVKDQVNSFDQHVWLSSSGTFEKKLIALSRDALFSSAKAVNKHLAINTKDRWALALPLSHIGGLSILVRSLEGNFCVSHYKQSWNALNFVKFLGSERCTITSLVPTQLYDIICKEIPPPPTLRLAVIGGAKLSEIVENKAKQLGWPIISSYGLTECCSQVATTRLESILNITNNKLYLLSHIEARVNDQRILEIKSPSLLSAYIKKDKNGVSVLNKINKNQFYTTNDLAEIQTDSNLTTLKIIGRADRQVKIRGWLISLDQIEEIVAQFFENHRLQIQFKIIAKEELREGKELILFVSKGSIASQMLDSINTVLCEETKTQIQIAKIIELSKFPLLENGKIDTKDLENRKI